MANGGNIQYGISFKVNDQDLKKIKQSLDDISLKLGVIQSGGKGTTTGGLEKLLPIEKVNEFKNALQQAYNPKLDTYNVKKFAEQISKSSISANELKTALKTTGSGGAVAFDAVTQSILRTKKQIIETNKFLDDMATSFSNTVKWGISSAVFNTMTNSISQAYGYVKNLDKSLNDIRIVTGKSADEMERFAKTANNAAKELGARTTDYTNASLIYYQQGLNNTETKARTETTLKAANVTGQDTAAVSEQLTAVWNGFNVATKQTEEVVDKLAAVAATTASDLEELATGMSKVASAASTMGVDVDQLSAQMSTIISVTRQAPESVGTALKTIYARLGDLKADGTDEFGVTLGEVSEQMQQMGINVMDESGNLRDMGEVIEEVSIKWNTWTKAQKNAAAIAMAGKRQYNNLFALFENWDMYEDALETSKNAMGTLEEQNNIYLDSVDAHLTQLRTDWEEFYESLIDEDTLKIGIGLFGELAKAATRLSESFGGGLGAMAGMGTIVTGLFNQQIGKGIANISRKKAQRHENERLANSRQEYEESVYGEMNPYEQSTEEFKQKSRQLDSNQSALTEEDVAQRQEMIQKLNDAQRKVETSKATVTLDTEKEIQQIQEQLSLEEKKEDKDENRISNLQEQLRLLNDQKARLEELFTLQSDYESMSDAVKAMNFHAGMESDKGILFNEETGEMDYSQIEKNIENLQIAKNFTAEDEGGYVEEPLEYAQDLDNQEFETKQEISKIEQDILKKEQESLSIKEKNAKNDKKKTAIEKEISKMQNDKVKLEKQLLEIDKKRGKNTKQYSKLDRTRKKEIEKILTTQIDIDEELEKNVKLLKEAKKYEEGIEKSKEAQEDLLEAERLKKETEEQIQQDNVLAKKVATTEMLTTSVGLLTSAYSGLSSVYQVWADENSSIGEKIASTFSTALLYGPMLIKMYGDMRTAAGTLHDKIVEGIALKQTENVVDKEGIQTTIDSTTAEAAETVAQEAGNEASKEAAVVGTAENTTEAIDATTSTASAGAEAAETTVKAAAIPVTGALAAAEGALSIISSSGLTTPIVLGALALLGVGAAVIGASSASKKKQEQNQQEQNTKTIEKEQANQEELYNQDAAFDKMKELNEEYKNGAISKFELRSQTMDLINEYKLEGDAISALIAGYGDYEEAVKNAKLQQLEELDVSIQREKTAASANLTQDSFVSKGKGYTFGDKYGVDVETGFVSSESQEFLRELKRQLDETGLEYTGDIVNGDELEFKSTDENFSKYIEAIRATQENVSSSALSSEAADIMQGQVDKFGDAVDVFDEAVSKESENKGKRDALEKITVDMTSEEYAQALVDYQKNNSKEEYEAFKTAAAEINPEAANIEEYTKAMVDLINEEYATEKIAQDKRNGTYQREASERNSNLISDITKDYGELYHVEWHANNSVRYSINDVLESILKDNDTSTAYKLLKDAYTKGGTFEVNGETYNLGVPRMSEDEFRKYWTFMDEFEEEYKENLKNQYNAKSMHFEAELSNLEDKDKLKILESGKYNEYYDDYVLVGENTDRGYKETTSDGRTEQKTVEEYATERAFQRILYEAEIEVNQETIDSLSTITDALETGKELTNEQEAVLTELEEQYSELGNIQDKSSDLYINKLNAIKDQLEENTIAASEASLSAGFEVAIADTDQLAKRLEDLTDADYDIKVAIEADMQSDFDEAVKQIEKMDDVSSKIGENFIVGAEDVEELATAFPGILTDVEYLSDGTIQLSEQATNAAINMAKEKAKADTETALEEIRNNKTLIEQKIAFADKMIQIAKSAANGEIKIDEAQTQAKELFEQTKIDFNTQATNQEIKNATASAENTAQATQDLADNYAGAYEAASNSAQKFAENAAKANKVASGDITLDSVEWTEDFKSTFKAKQSTAPEELVSDKLTESKEYSKLTDRAKWGETLQAWEAQREMWNDLLAEADGKEAELIARQNALDYKFGNVKSGKGADGGDDSGSDPNQEDYIEDEIDKFHDLEKAIQRTEDALDRLATAEERAFGQDLIDNLDAQLENLEGQTALQEKKKDLAIQEAAILQTSLASQGVSFDEEGAITNYQSIIAEKINATNKIIEAYNGMSASEQEANEETVNKAKEDLEKFQKEIENYEEYIYDTIPEIQSRIDEIMDEKVEINVKKLNMEVDLRMKIVDSKDAFRTFKTQVLDGLEEGMLGYAKSTLTGIQGMFGSTLDAINADYKNLQLVQSEIQKMQKGETSNVFGNNMQVALEELENIQDRLMENMTSYYELQEEANETYNAALDKLQEMLDLQQELYSSLNDIFEHGKEVVELLYGEDNWDSIIAFDTEQYDILLKALADSNTALEESKKRLDELEVGTEEWCAEQERYNNLLSQTNDLENQVLQKSKDIRNNNIEKVLKEQEQALFGTSFEEAKENWEKVKKESDKYFDSIERGYQMDTLERSFNKAFSQNNSSIKAQRQLNQLKDEELKKLKEKENLSQYDVDRAQKLLDIEMAKIALEEAQNNKSTLKLKRDAQGNYSYQYVANQDDIAEKEQQLADAQNDLYQMDQEEYKTQMDEQFATYEEYANKVRGLQELGLLETEEFNRKLQESHDNLMNNMKLSHEDMHTVRTNLENSFFNNMTEEKVPEWANDMEQMIINHNTLETKIDEGTTKIEGYWEEAQFKMDEVSTLINKDYGDIIGSTISSANATQILSGQVSNLTEEYKKDVAQAKLVKNAIDEITKSQENQIKKAGEAIIKNQEFYTTIQQDAATAASKITQSFGQMAIDVKSYLDQASTYAAQAVEEAKKAADAAKAAAGWNGDINNPEVTGIQIARWGRDKYGKIDRNLTETVNIGSKVMVSGSHLLIDSDGSKAVEGSKLGNQDDIRRKNATIVSIDESKTYGIKIKLADGTEGYVSKNMIWSMIKANGESFDTGGYTGEWDSSARLAWLHEKELVLNKTDTENMLKAIELTRSMDDIINSLESSVVNRINRLTQQLNEMVECINIKAKLKDTEQKFEQNVQIHAEFPNVKGVDEIEQAFENLNNRATQLSNYLRF